jgi:predicted esterase/catechol 2,3-dioxygenase-like lactoylglutathione lyase family enzyme
MSVLGIHHVTAIAGDPQRNLNFYAGVLGLRLVKRTVNYDDPTTYHFYFGDAVGTPGSILTFFPWPGARRGRRGPGQVATTSFAIAPAATGFWIHRLLRSGIAFEGPTKQPGADAERVITFEDPDGLSLELVTDPGAEARPAWREAADIPPEAAIHGFHSVTLWAERGEATEQVLAETLGFRLLREVDGVRRFTAGDGGPGTLVNLRAVGGFPSGVEGAGTVHHVAWRATDDAAQLELRNGIQAAGLDPTPVIDRTYFHSVYFREPGGILFELATDAPGFGVDEPLASLGQHLTLPARFEAHRGEIEAVLPPAHLPGSAFPSPGDLGFVHRYLPSGPGSGTTLLLLHGTGGDENDLLSLGRALSPGAALLSPRGKVLERGAPRFFRRLAEGVFDQEDLADRTEELARFVEAAVAQYQLASDSVVAVGFSNGANIAGSILLRRPGLLRAAVLLSPMVPFEPAAPPDLRGTAVFIGAGRSDPIVPPGQVERLAEILRGSGAAVTVHWEPGGHTVTDAETAAAKAWLERLGPHVPRLRSQPVS